MKANRLFCIALAGLCAAAIIPTGTVFAAAEDKTTVYPQNFEHNLEDFLTAKNEDGSFKTVIQDYAVHGDTVAFAYNTTITVLSYDEAGERKRTDFTHGSGIAALDYDAEGNLYFKNALKETYLYAPQLVSVDDYNFQPLDSAYESLGGQDGVFYTLEKPAGELSYWSGGERTKIDEGFSLMKKYGGCIYCVKENLLYKIDGLNSERPTLTYTDFKDADNIFVGDTAKNLKADGYEVKMARLDSGKYFTKIDPEKLGEKFIQKSTKKLEGEMTCLVLCESGNASVFATKDGMFITATENLHEEAYSPSPNDWKINSHGERAAYATEDVGVYASPYMSACTRIATLKSGNNHPVKVIEKVEKRILNFLSTDFYRVTYEENGETVTGFVAANFLSEYDFAAEDNKPEEAGREQFKYDTNVTTVVLVVIVVALVLIAILYLTIISTGKKAKNKKKTVKPVNDEEDEHQPAPSNDTNEEE